MSAITKTGNPPKSEGGNTKLLGSSSGRREKSPGNSSQKEDKPSNNSESDNSSQEDDYQDKIPPTIIFEEDDLRQPHIIIGEFCGDESDDSENDRSNSSAPDKRIKTNSRSFRKPIKFPIFEGNFPVLINHKNIIEEKISNSNLPPHIRDFVINRLADSDTEKPKQLEWLNNLLSVPFDTYIPLPISRSDSMQKLQQFFESKKKMLDEKIYGLNDMKEEIYNYLAQFITSKENPDYSPRVLALYGSPGVGKTYIIRHALSDILNLPIKCINMGGVKDSAHFIGFDFTYSNARFGVIVQSLIDMKAMNPIICFEEIDKVSETKEGMDIQYTLMHITDPEQNKGFQDKYFSGINFDISKATFVMTLNDPANIHPILLNRLHLIKIPDPSMEDKVMICINHIIPSICKNIGFDPNNVNINRELLCFIHNKYCKNDKGLRSMKRSLESIIFKLNTIHLIGYDISKNIDNIKFPVKVTEKIVEKILDKNRQEKDEYLSMYM